MTIEQKLLAFIAAVTAAFVLMEAASDLLNSYSFYLAIQHRLCG